MCLQRLILLIGGLNNHNLGEVNMRERRMIGQCPVCGEAMHVTRLECDYCHSALEGHFSVCRFCKLTSEQQRFIEVFISSRGNIREVERILNISYPTVRSRLDAVIEALGYTVERERDEQVETNKRRAILEALEKGELSVREALKQIKG
jgi:hypothetical protein